MKHAQLWKMILSSGLGNAIGDDGVDKITPRIVKAPQIVDSRPSGREILVSHDWYGLALPFLEFWMEGVLSDEARWGALVFSRNEGESHAVECVGVLHRPSDPRPFFLGGYRFRLDSRGNTISGSRELMMDPWRVQKDGLDSTKEVTAYIGAFVCDTLQLLGCRNVSLSPRDNEGDQVRRAVKRYGGNPDSYRYHVLVVRPAGAKSDSPGIDIGTMPRHVCRGHFNHYGPASEHGHPDGLDRGMLFGKYAGRYFVPPTYKGDKKNGIVEKDYEIPPDGGEQ